MNQRQLINILLSVTLINSLTLGCNFFTSLAGTPDPNQEIINTAIQDAQSGSLEGAYQAEQDMLNLLREQSGARAAFGDQADAIFLQIDQARAAALEEMTNQVMGGISFPLKVSALRAKTGALGTTRTSPLDTKDYQMKSTVGILMMFALTPQFANVGRDENGNAIGPITEGGDPVGAAGEHYTFQPKLIGSRLEATGTIKIIIKEPFPYEESAEYTLKMELCPDAQGNAPLQLSFKSGVALLGGGVQLGVDSQVTGRVNDEGTLNSWDDKSTFQGARQPIQGVGEDLGTANNYFEFQLNMTNYTNPDIPSTATGDYIRQSSETDEKFNWNAMKNLTLMKGMMIFTALNFAEEKWTTGYCVELQVPGLGAGGMRVQPNSETPFTAKVRHKFENAELNVPVIATLSDGQVSVSPSGSKVPAPAKFIYTAPDKSGQSATVHLETRSKRGGATLDVNFTTGGGWKIPLTSTFTDPLGAAGKCTGWLSCGSPYGPWDITCESTNSLVKTTFRKIIPFSEDGKTTATLEEHQLTTGNQSGNDSFGTIKNVTITPNSGGYQINFPATHIVGKSWVIDSQGIYTEVPFDQTWGAEVWPIVPADPGECSQP